MQLIYILSSLLSLTIPLIHSAPTPYETEQQTPLFSERPSDTPTSALTIPSRYNSTILARRLLSLSTVGDLATIFPHDLSSSPYSRTPSSVASTPIALPEYIASCEPSSGDPTLIALDVSTSTKNAARGSNVSLSVSWWDEYVKLTHKEPWAKADLPRLALVGYLEKISDKEVEEKGVVECFQNVHRDSRLWTPGRKGAAHGGKWVRVKVQEVYWIGGFGDKHYIGWLDVKEWKGVRREEWELVRLPGEKS